MDAKMRKNDSKRKRGRIMKIDVEKLESIMYENGWSQAEFCRRAKISRSYFCKILSGKREGGSAFLIGLTRVFPDHNIRDFILEADQKNSEG